jgi:hypothetical protein
MTLLFVHRTIMAFAMQSIARQYESSIAVWGSMFVVDDPVKGIAAGEDFTAALL